MWLVFFGKMQKEQAILKRTTETLDTERIVYQKVIGDGILRVCAHDTDENGGDSDQDGFC